MLGELDDTQIEDVLHEATVGRLGCHADGRTYVVPVTYAYDGIAIYAHSGAGLKLRMMRKNPEVCFEVDMLENFANWRSVIAWGHFEELYGAAADEALRLLESRFTPLVTSETALPKHGLHPHAGVRADPTVRASIYRVVLRERTGRYEKR